MVVLDPYQTLHVPHSASHDQIKRAYRELARKYHPDRLIHQSVTTDDKERSSSAFAEIASAYALLSDPKRKAEYDHIYKYGGYDDKPAKIHASSTSAASSVDSSQQYLPRKRKSTGVGYTCTDPLAFLWTQGKIQYTRTVAGIQIPNRIQLGSQGLRFAFSSGHFSTDARNGTSKYITRTTQFAQGKKYTVTETTVVHPDGRRDVIIEDNGNVQRRYSTPPKKTKSAAMTQDHVQAHQQPWYILAWHEIKDKVTMCYSNCAADSPVQQ